METRIANGECERSAEVKVYRSEFCTQHSEFAWCSFLVFEYYCSVTSRQTYVVAGIVFLCFLAFSLTRLGGFALDETLAHFPNALNFYGNGIDAIFNSHYSAANTPLPYVIVALAAKVAGPSLLVARIVTCVISFLAFLVVVRLLKLADAPQYLSFVVLFYPYVFLNSFVFYTVNYGLLFVLLSLLFLYRADNQVSIGRDLVAGLFLALAVLCQQFYLVVLVAVLLTRFVAARVKGNTATPYMAKKEIASSALFALPMVLPGMLFIAWGGLAHPNFQSNAIGFYPSTIVATLSVTGFYFAPLLVQAIRDLTRQMVLVALGVSTVLSIAFRPNFSDKYGPGMFAGIAHHVIALTDYFHSSVPVLLTIVLTTCGILVLVVVWNDLKRQWEYFLYTSCLLLAVAYACYSYIGERNLLGYIVFLFLLVVPRLRKPLQWIYPAAMAAFGITYFVWWLFYKWALF